jgi:uncharacterized protein (TIGR00369 family)
MAVHALHVDAVTEYFACVNEERFDDLLALFTPDAQLQAPGVPLLRGLEEIRDYYERAFRPYPVHRDEPMRIVRAGPTATVDIRFTGTIANGAELQFDAVDVFDLAPDGRIARCTSWYDSHRVREMLSAAKAGGVPAGAPAPAQTADAHDFEMLRERCNGLALCADLRLCCTSMGDGTASVSMSVPGGLRHGDDVIPGVYLAALADAAGSFALHTVTAETDQLATLNINVHFLRPVRGEPVTATGRVVRAGRTQAFVRVDVHDGGRLCATAIGGWTRIPDSPNALFRH